MLQEVAARGRRDAEGWVHDGLLAGDLITRLKLFTASPQPTGATRASALPGKALLFPALQILEIAAHIVSIPSR